MSSPALMSTPKSQLTAEQPSVKKTGTYQERYSTSKGIKKKPNEIVGRGCIYDIIKSHTTQVVDPQTGEQLYRRSSPTGVSVLSPMSGSPAWGSGIERRSPQSIWLWRPVGFECRSSPELGETDTLLLEGTHKVSGQKQRLHRSLGQTYLLVLEGLRGRRGGGRGSLWGQWHWWWRNWGNIHQLEVFWKSLFWQQGLSSPNSL